MSVLRAQLICTVVCLVLLYSCDIAGSNNFSFIDLPKEHIPYYFNSYPQVAANCNLDPECPYKVSLPFLSTHRLPKPTGNNVNHSVTNYIDKTRLYTKHLHTYLID